MNNINKNNYLFTYFAYTKSIYSYYFKAVFTIKKKITIFDLASHLVNLL